ncbi:MAG: cold shock domain-containing protein [Leptospirales bacterium]
MDEPSKKDNRHDTILDRLNSDFQEYHDKFSQQFHLKIPKNTIKTVHYYRDTLFPYLKDSVYKSNICYLLQSVDYQLWLYKVFRPSLSLENAYFYQLLVSMGIIVEAIVVAILLNPFMEEDAKDRSLGSVGQDYTYIHDHITKNAFSGNIRLLEKVNILPVLTIEKLQAIRVEIRNLVHIQNWEGRLYQSLGYDRFSGHLNDFVQFLDDVKENIKPNEDAETVITKLGFSSNVEKEGSIIDYKEKGGFGFIRCRQTHTDYYFHISFIDKAKTDLNKLRNGLQVRFKLRKGAKGLEAFDLTLQNRNDESQ